MVCGPAGLFLTNDAYSFPSCLRSAADSFEVKIEKVYIYGTNLSFRCLDGQRRIQVGDEPFYGLCWFEKCQSEAFIVLNCAEELILEGFIVSVVIRES